MDELFGADHHVFGSKRKNKNERKSTKVYTLLSISFTLCFTIYFNLSAFKFIFTVLEIQPET